MARSRRPKLYIPSRILLHTLFALGCMAFCATGHAKNTSPFTTANVTLTNPTDLDLIDHQVHLHKSKLSVLAKSFKLEGITLTTQEKAPQVVISQVVDSDQNGENDTLVFNADIPASGALALTLTALPNTRLSTHSPKRAQFDMGVMVNGDQNEKGMFSGGKYRQVTSIVAPNGQKRGNRLFRYEGFGWESDKVGYRYYFDQRSTIDIFGKRLPSMVLHKVGLEGGNYHVLEEWGMDILKVGTSLGLGSLGFFEDGKAQNLSNSKNLRVAMVDDGPLLACFDVRHDDWRVAGKKTDVKEHFSIAAGSRLTKATVTLSKNLPHLTTGIVKAGLSPMVSNDVNSTWGYLATYGNTSLEKDGLGMVIFFKTAQLQQLTDDQHSHLVVLKPNKRVLTYHFAAAWAQEFNGIKNQTAFLSYLEETRKTLNQPIQIKVHQ